jgi:hypothetical protein
MTPRTTAEPVIVARVFDDNVRAEPAPQAASRFPIPSCGAEPRTESLSWSWALVVVAREMRGGPDVVPGVGRVLRFAWPLDGPAPTTREAVRALLTGKPAR